MTDVVNEKTIQMDHDLFYTNQTLSNGKTREIRKTSTKIITIKTINQDGSYIIVNGDNVKIEELTSDGIYREYNPKTKKLRKEKTPEQITTTFYDNENIETILDEKNHVYSSYYENKRLSKRQEKDYEIFLDIDGNINYELKNGKLYINPDWFSYYRLGVKSLSNDIHWQEQCTLDPTKKTLLSLGGDQTNDAKAANGNNNVFANVLGLTPRDKDNMQMVSCYRPHNTLLRLVWYKVDGFKEHYYADYRREILQKFMPFMAHEIDGKYERYTNERLAQNFRNIMIQAHCYGANDIPVYSKVFKEIMTKLGYSEQAQQYALKQIICVTNNTQRDLTDNTGFTCIHRYTVKDGQMEPEYKTKESSEYPVFIQDYKAFTKLKGTKSAFIETRPNELIMAFDKIMSDTSNSSEHNEAFWTTYEEMLTPIGKLQKQLMELIGRFWYQNEKEIPDIATLITMISKDTPLNDFVTQSLDFGKKLRREKRSALFNHHIIESAWNKFKNPESKPSKTGIYKILSDKYKD